MFRKWIWNFVSDYCAIQMKFCIILYTKLATQSDNAVVISKKVTINNRDEGGINN